jgi:hypothetical protein
MAAPPREPTSPRADQLLDGDDWHTEVPIVTLFALFIIWTMVIPALVVAAAAVAPTGRLVRVESPGAA